MYWASANHDEAEIGFHSTYNRAPLSVPITFTPVLQPRTGGSRW
jgi:hypothetical protein